MVSHRFFSLFVCVRLSIFQNQLQMFKQPAQLGGRKPLVQFRAGKMSLKDGVVTADPTRGVFSLVSDPTGAFEIFWTSDCGSQSEQFILLKGQASVSRVAKCTTGRVFLIDVAGQRQTFYWLQDKNTEHDDEFLKKLKAALENPPTTAPKAASSSQPAPAGLQIDALQRILADLGADVRGQEIQLQDIISSSLLLDALREDPAFYMTRLHEHLPQGTAPDADIVDEIKNPQVSASARLLQAALQDPAGFREVSAAFKVGGSGNSVGVTAFLQRLLDEAKTKK